MRKSYIKGYAKFQPDPARLVAETIPLDYITSTQMPGYDAAAAWQNLAEQAEFIRKNRLRFLRLYQQRAAKAIQTGVRAGQTRFLFEMATGTGKTRTAAAVIKLFLRTGNARRVLFLFDRLELENQANKAFTFLLKNDYKSSIYKENHDDWRKAEIVVTTVQSLLHNNKYRQLFAPPRIPCQMAACWYGLKTSRFWTWWACSNLQPASTSPLKT